MIEKESGGIKSAKIKDLLAERIGLIFEDKDTVSIPYTYPTNTNSNTNNIDNSNKEVSIPNTKPKYDDELWFSEIWKIYPRKVNKVLAKKTFIKKIKGMSYDNAYELAKKIYILLKKQIEAWQNENNGEGRKLEHIPHLSTWLSANVEDSK